MTNVAADYTSLGSFGTAQTFGDNLVGSMDRSYLLRGGLFKDKDGPSQTAKLLDAREAGGMYYLKYTGEASGWVLDLNSKTNFNSVMDLRGRAGLGHDQAAGRWL